MSADGDLMRALDWADPGLGELWAYGEDEQRMELAQRLAKLDDDTLAHLSEEKACRDACIWGVDAEVCTPAELVRALTGLDVDLNDLRTRV